ncbi:MAG: hypothetical protein J5697_02020 [Clostridia bacterium]|nr:hypothetical protein [Clostridia bacterium]
MKKLPKILAAILTGLTMILSSVLAFGCGGSGAGASMSMSEYNALVSAAAEDFYSAHTDPDSFRDITYRWTVNETNKNSVTLEYKENAEDEETVSGTFLNQTVTSETYSVAVKKVGDDLIAQYTVSSTVTNNGYDVKDDGTLDNVISTTVTSKTFRLLAVTEDNETAYYMITDMSTKTDDEDAEVTKLYLNFSSSDSYYDAMNDYMIKEPNENVKRTFFESAEIFMVYSSIIKTEKNGGQLSISIGYGITDVNVSSADYDITSISLNAKTVFENNKILKAEGRMTNKNKTMEFNRTCTFDFVNSAIVDTVFDVADYEYSHNDYFRPAIDDNLPYANSF